MNIVVEGPDATGKSTVAHLIANATGRTLISSEGPPKSDDDVHDRVKRFSQYQNVVFDRHPCISDLIYSTVIRGKNSPISPYEIAEFYGSEPLIIYCRHNGLGLKHHRQKEYDSEEHITKLKERYQAVCGAYDTWAVFEANIIYRMNRDPLGDDLETLIRQARQFDSIRDVEEFHKHFGLDYRGKPRAFPRELEDFRVDFMFEELNEYVDHSRMLRTALEMNDQAEVNLQLAECFDALLDLKYVVEGTLHLHGFPVQAGWDRVHRANMAKVSGDGQKKIAKPLGWEPPSHVDLIEDNIHRTPSDVQARCSPGVSSVDASPPSGPADGDANNNGGAAPKTAKDEETAPKPAI
jgi:predicted HAD superfamily Cof-like phosphohydrolase